MEETELDNSGEESTCNVEIQSSILSSEIFPEVKWQFAPGFLPNLVDRNHNVGSWGHESQTGLKPDNVIDF